MQRRIAALLGADPGNPAEVERVAPLVVITTTGDRVQDRRLLEIGGKGLFTKEIEEALTAGSIDLAVHSAKDMATQLPEGLVIAAVLEREDVRDAFISLKYASLAQMPSGAKVGTSSLRRQAQVKAMRPDLEVVGFRGNVQTRLSKLEAGVADATFLAVAGLNRLGQSERVTRAVPVSEMLPAAAQGAIAVQIRGEDQATRQLVGPLDHSPTALAITAERAFLARLDGSCRTPIGGLAQLENGNLTIRGEILLPDGTVRHTTVKSGPPERAAAIGEAAAAELIALAGPEFLRRLV